MLGHAIKSIQLNVQIFVIGSAYNEPMSAFGRRSGLCDIIAPNPLHSYDAV